MSIKGWKYYNHAAIPSTAPNEPVNMEPINNGRIWSIDKSVFMVRWTDEWDCNCETNWWYVIKDTPFDISAIKSKRRYEINKGIKNFEVRIINPKEFVERLYTVTESAYQTYPASYRPNVNHDSFVNEITRNGWDCYKTYGAFAFSDGELCGYINLRCDNKYIDFCEMKSIPEREKLGLNAAMVYQMLVDHNIFLSQGGLICDGARSIQHETAFQDYLEKYFEFRKAYCRLHIKYRTPLNMAVKALYPLRNAIQKHGNMNFTKKISALLRMEEIRRSFG